MDADENLLWLLNQFKKGNSLKIVAENLISEGYDGEEVEAFLQEIVESGLIIDTFYLIVLLISFISRIIYLILN